MKHTAATLPVTLTIAGSDSGGGAGIQADLKTFAALGTHGTSAITCLTAQNPKAVTGIQAASPAMVQKQIEAVFAELKPATVKTGMLFSTPIIKIITEFFSQAKMPPLIVDPVMVSTSGARLLKSSAIKAVKEELLPLATLVTPNLDEAALLVNRPLSNVEDLRSAAREIFETYGCAALVKGGHLKDSREAIDIFYDDENELMLTAPYVRGVSTHGTGCTYSAAITGYLALGCELPIAVELGKNFITQAITQHEKAAKHSVLNSFWEE
ncbi:MAG TPA: bifunctional hydroxymethylpyrimidine kinase/phosphomethylpyrimidine kinase [Verrucomicrobiae bacterium]